jgi:hypothetical protein
LEARHKKTEPLTHEGSVFLFELVYRNAAFNIIKY